MPDHPRDDSEPAPSHLWRYPAHNLVVWRPEGILDDGLLDEIGTWLCRVENPSEPFDRFVDFSRLTEIAVRTNHVFEFARKRAEQFAAIRPVRSAFFAEDWVGFSIARIYETLMQGTLIEVRAFRDRAKAAEWLGVPVEALKRQDNPAPSG